MMENIAIIMGGDSDEKYISLKSGDTIYKHIDRTKYNPIFNPNSPEEVYNKYNNLY